MDRNVSRSSFLERVFSQWGDAVYRVALAQLRDAALAQDVVQDVFIRLIDAAPDFTGDEHVKAWLIRVTINRCRDIQRSVWRSRVDSLEGDGLDERLAGRDEDRAFAAEPGQPSAEDIESHPVWRAMEALSEDQRLVIHLKYVEECDDRAIAELMGVAPATVRTRLHRARAKLKQVLEAERAKSAERPDGSEPKRFKRGPACSHAPRAPDNPVPTSARKPAHFK